MLEGINWPERYILNHPSHNHTKITALCCLTLSQIQLSNLNCPIFSKRLLPESEAFQKGPYILLDTTQISSGAYGWQKCLKFIFAKVLREPSKITSSKPLLLSVPSAIYPFISFSFQRKFNINFSQSAFTRYSWPWQTLSSFKRQAMGSNHFSTNRTLPSAGVGGELCILIQLVNYEPSP